MIRTIVGIVIGFVVILVVQFVTLTIAYLWLGMDGTFRPGTFELSPLWLVVQAVFALAAGIIAGKVCRVISGRGWAMIPFVIFILVLGLLASIPALLVGDTVEARVGAVSTFQAMLSGRAPRWYSVAIPFVSALGVAMGGKSKKN